MRMNSTTRRHGGSSRGVDTGRRSGLLPAPPLARIGMTATATNDFTLLRTVGTLDRRPRRTPGATAAGRRTSTVCQSGAMLRSSCATSHAAGSCCLYSWSPPRRSTVGEAAVWVAHGDAADDGDADIGSTVTWLVVAGTGIAQVSPGLTDMGVTFDVGAGSISTTGLGRAAGGGGDVLATMDAVAAMDAMAASAGGLMTPPTGEATSVPSAAPRRRSAEPCRWRWLAWCSLVSWPTSPTWSGLRPTSTKTLRAT
jgi:hypothetical protein